MPDSSTTSRPRSASQALRRARSSGGRDLLPGDALVALGAEAHGALDPGVVGYVHVVLERDGAGEDGAVGVGVVLHLDQTGRVHEDGGTGVGDLEVVLDVDGRRARARVEGD